MAEIVGRSTWFEQEHGWHVNLMPEYALTGFPVDWKARAVSKNYGLLRVIVPSAKDLLIPKLSRGEPRDRVHAEWTRSLGLC